MTNATSGDRLLLGLLLVAAAAGTLLVHLRYLPRQYPEGFTSLLPSLVVGWVSFGLVFYALGRLSATPEGLPSMRSADLGVALFLGSVVVSGLLDASGLTVEAAPLVHALPAVGVYVGLALAGWGIGRRTALINRLTRERVQRGNR